MQDSVTQNNNCWNKREIAIACGTQPLPVHLFTQIWRSFDLDLEARSRSYRCAPLVEYYPHTKFHLDRWNCVDVRTDVGLPNFKITWPVTGEEIQKSGVTKFTYFLLVSESVIKLEIGWETAESENGTFCNFEGHLTLEQGLGHIIVHHSSSTTHTPNFIPIGQSNPITQTDRQSEL